jgi:surfeit locus 1 family protein
MIGARTAVSFAAAAAAIVLTTALGQWQLRRADEKLALQAQWDRAQQAPAVAVSGEALDTIAGRLPLRVALRGRFLHEHELWLDNRQMDGRAGFMLVTPLRLADGAVVLVNRGFAPRDALDRGRLPPVARPQEEVSVEGLAVPHPARVLQLGREAAAPGGGPTLWQNLDYDAYERQSGLAVPRWVVQQTDGGDDGLRRNWPRLAAGVDKHRGYALQWFSLAALLATLSLFFGVRAMRRRLLPNRSDE